MFKKILAQYGDEIVEAGDTSTLVMGDFWYAKSLSDKTFPILIVVEFMFNFLNYTEGLRLARMGNFMIRLKENLEKQNIERARSEPNTGASGEYKICSCKLWP